MPLMPAIASPGHVLQMGITAGRLRYECTCGAVFAAEELGAVKVPSAEFAEVQERVRADGQAAAMEHVAREGGRGGLNGRSGQEERDAKTISDVPAESKPAGEALREVAPVQGALARRNSSATPVRRLLEELREEHVRVYGTKRKWIVRTAWECKVCQGTLRDWFRGANMPRPENLQALVDLLAKWRAMPAAAGAKRTEEKAA